MLQQVNNDVHAAHKAGHMQWSEARLKDKHILHYQTQYQIPVFTYQCWNS